MNGKIIGSILIIIGTSLGAGMLALPTATAAGGFYHAALVMFGTWVLMTMGALFILEVNLWLPDGANLVSMAKATLGPLGQVVTWLAYLLLLYSLISAYIAGGSDLLQYLLGIVHIHAASSIATILFTLLLGSIVFYGVRAVDVANRGLMSVKVIAYVLLIILIMPHVQSFNLNTGHYHALLAPLMLLFTAFGYATVIPTLRSYFKGDAKKLRLVVWVGSFITLIFYIFWNLVVQGSLKSAGPHGLAHMAQSGHAASLLTAALSTRLHSLSINYLTHLFTSICVTTSFLGVSLCLTDFLADGWKLQKTGGQRWLIIVATFLPPVAIVLFDPAMFIKGLSYAGIACVILLMLLPALMTYSGRYIKKIATHEYQVFGGKLAIILLTIVAVYLIAHGATML